MKPRFVMPLASRNPRSVRRELKDRSRSSFKIYNFTSDANMCVRERERVRATGTSLA